MNHLQVILNDQVLFEHDNDVVHWGLEIVTMESRPIALSIISF
jgi:hypothetical protein